MTDKNMTAVIRNGNIINEKLIRVGVSANFRHEFVPAHTIICCKALNNYTRIYFENERPVLVCHTLGYFEEKLTDAGFIRIHRSELINKRFIAKCSRHGVVQLKDGTEFTISRRRKQKVLEAIAC